MGISHHVAWGFGEKCVHRSKISIVVCLNYSTTTMIEKEIENVHESVVCRMRKVGEKVMFDQYARTRRQNLGSKASIVQSVSRTRVEHALVPKEQRQESSKVSNKMSDFERTFNHVLEYRVIICRTCEFAVVLDQAECHIRVHHLALSI